MYNHPATFGEHSHCDSGDLTYLICHVTLQDYVIKGSCDFMEGSSTFYGTTLPSLVATRILLVKICFLIYFMTSRDVFKGVLARGSFSC